MIPKIIHYIWLGGNPLPEMVEKCIKSWKKFCPDFEIKRWDESNLNLDINPFTRQAYDAKKYAFAADSLRFYILKAYGGVYLDVDVEIVRPINVLLDEIAFGGFEKWSDKFLVNPGLIFGSEKGGKIVSDIFEIYNNDSFINPDGSFNYTTVCDKTTKYLEENYSFVANNTHQKFADVTIYPTEYFCPINGVTKKEEFLTENTYSKHLYLASWVPKQSMFTKFKNKIKTLIKKIVGEEKIKKIKTKMSKGKK